MTLAYRLQNDALRVPTKEDLKAGNNRGDLYALAEMLHPERCEPRRTINQCLENSDDAKAVALLTEGWEEMTSTHNRALGNWLVSLKPTNGQIITVFHDVEAVAIIVALVQLKGDAE